MKCTNDDKSESKRTYCIQNKTHQLPNHATQNIITTRARNAKKQLPWATEDTESSGCLHETCYKTKTMPPPPTTETPPPPRLNTKPSPPKKENTAQQPTTTEARKSTGGNNKDQSPPIHRQQQKMADAAVVTPLPLKAER
mmetsp:Transcript_10056/g.18082  ORF Transcript_10056/g.18082 Transcript_10056/m.18082 type:complete len:140 (+) Transcript_10056:283-702(+)